MDELKRSKERLEKLREELHSARRELEPLEDSWRERTEREVEELVAFAKERGHSWVQCGETEEHAMRRLLTVGSYGSGFAEGGPHYKAKEKVRSLEGKVRWWEKKITREEYSAWKAQLLAKRREA